MHDDIKIRRIDYNSADYNEELQLRNRVLRIPLGLSLFDEPLGNEAHDHHVGLFSGGKLVGVLILTPLDKGEIQMRQVAVDEIYQGKGLGALLVEHAEALSKDLGNRKIVLHARTAVTGFYEKLGYQSVGEVFTEVSIPHIAMEKILI